MIMKNVEYLLEAPKEKESSLIFTLELDDEGRVDLKVARGSNPSNTRILATIERNGELQTVEMEDDDWVSTYFPMDEDGHIVVGQFV